MCESHTSAFNVEFCVYGTHVRLYVMAGVPNLAGHLYSALLLPPLASIVLPLSLFFIE